MLARFQYAAIHLTAYLASRTLAGMSTARKIRPTDKAIKGYYAALEAYRQQDVGHETAVSTAFQSLLDQLGRHFGWTLIPQLADTTAGRSIRPDGTSRRQRSG